jgi:hypothetical protein
VRVIGSHFSRKASDDVLFSAERTSPDGAGSFLASTTEVHGKTTIYRTVKAEGPAGSLAIEPDLSAATVEPRRLSPGSASFTADPGKQSGSWLGDLTVSFPGRPDTRLAGPKFGGEVLKPGQCSPDEKVFCLGIGFAE